MPITDRYVKNLAFRRIDRLASVASDPTPGEIETDSLVGVLLHQILHQRNVVYLHEQVDSLGL
jgi:hypothetical protein